MMTTDEAIRILDPATTLEALAEHEYYGGFSGQAARVDACNEACRVAIAALRRSAEDDKAREEGRLVVLPCKVGDTVWAVTSPANIPEIDFDDERPMIFECNVESITLYHRSDTQLRLYYKGHFLFWFVKPYDFGKTVFLTRQEAEAALEGGGEQC